MGTLLGHIVPGMFNLIAGLWWSFNIFSSYFMALKNRRRFTSYISYQLRHGSRMPWESIIGIVNLIGAIVGEIYTGWVGDRLVEMGNGQHAAMYMMFALTCVVEAARVLGYEVVPGLEYAVAVMAFASEALLFALHGHGTSPMEMMVHHLLLYVVLANAAAVAAEGVWRHSVLAALARAFFVLLQGSWFLQVGFILYPPAGWPGHHWDPNSERQIKLATVAFVIHWAVVLITLSSIGLFIRWRSGLGFRSRTPMVKNERERNGGATTQLLQSSEDEL